MAAGGVGEAHVRRQQLSRAAVDGMVELAREQGMAPGAIVVAGLAVVLARSRGRQQLRFGVVAGEKRTVIFDVRPPDDDTCADWVRIVGKDLDEAVADAVHASPSEAVELDALLSFGAALEAGHPAALGLSLVEDAPQDIRLTSRMGWFDGAGLEALGSRLAAVIERMVRTPERRVDELRIATDLEAVRLATWNDTGLLTDVEPVPAAVLLQAARTPRARAVEASDATLSYEELVGRAAQLANHLVALGAGTDEVVGVLVPRTADLVVAALGIFLSGAAYLPLDPGYPPDRLRFMLDDARVRVVVTTGSVADGIVCGNTCVVRLDADRATLEALPRLPPEVTFHPESKAYVIYTSGSTGLPKGVVVEHRNLAALVGWAAGAYSREELRSVAASTSLCFDLSAYELFVPFSVGGAVLLLENALDLAPGGRPTAPTLVNSVPSAMEAVLRVGQLPSSVRVVNVAGEPLSAKLLADLLATGDDIRVCNLYGPSEDTVYSTSVSFSVPEGNAPAIGHPITGTKAWVLDDFGHPLPPGMPGELFLGGQGVARGYHDRPALTAERFVPDPFSGERGARLYRTGDVVRRRDDGALEFLGRRDHQVKVRGHRIELPEIELALLRHPRVREAAVVVSGNAAAERALAAFVTLDGRGGSIGDIERFVADQLPSYMVPQRITILDGLPRTPNGKVDREALHDATATSGTGSAELRTATERMLAAIWCSVLGLDAVGRDDDFFRLGGQSLLAMQVVARVQAALGIELPLVVLFDERTLAAVAAYLDANQRRRSRVRRPVRLGRSRGPLSPTQRDFVASDSAASVPAVAPILRLLGSLDLAALEGALNEVGRRHESLHTVFRTSLGRSRQVVKPWEHIPLIPFDVRRKGQARSGPGAAQLIADTLTMPFDLATGPLFRWTLVQHSKTEHVLAIAAHEVAADGWSMPIVLSELATFYADLVGGRPPSLPEPPLQYLDIALWQRRTQRRGTRRREIRYWKARLQDAPVALDPMPDRWPDAETVADPRQETLRLEVDVAERLRTVAREEGCTLYMVLFAAFQAVMHRWTGEPTVVLRSTVANRNVADGEGVVGFFANHVLMSTDVSANPSFRELLARVRRDQLDVADHTKLPYRQSAGRAVAMRTVRRGFWPFGRLRFQVLDFPHSSPVQFPGLQVQPEAPPVPMAEHFAMLGFEQPDRSVEFALSYDGAWFERTTVARLLSQFEAVLDAMCEDRDARVDDVPLLDRRASDTALRAGRGQGHEPPFRPVHELVAELAQRTPDATAVVCGPESLSYADLDHWADAVAAFVIEGTSAPEARVVVAANGAAGVVAVLGAWRAGALCIPAPTPGDPASVTRIVEHARADLVLTEADVLGASTARWEARAMPIVEEAAAALALYCSGQGQPSASVVTHGALSRAALCRRTSTGMRNRDRWGVLPAARAGQAMGAVWPALIAGATVVLPSEDAVDNPAAWVADQAITVCSADAGLVPDLLTGAARTRMPLRTVLTSEPVSAPEGRIPVQLEEEVWLAEAALPILTSRASRTAAAPAFVGTATPGTHVLVLDRSLQLVPPGAAGELFVDASHLARGYLDDPKATALRFVPNPWSGRAGARMASTGLLGRVAANNRIEVLGSASPGRMRGVPVARYAQQLEAVVRSHAGVAGVVVRVQSVLGEARFVVFVERRRGVRLGRREVMDLVPDYFPAAMTPAEVVFLDAFPRAPDGRVDVAALGTRRKGRA